MKQLPLIPKVIINIVLLGLYFVIWLVIAGILHSIVSLLVTGTLPEINDPIYDSIGWATLVATFIVTLVFRKYFYMPLHTEEEEMPHKKKKHDFSME